MMMLFPGAVRIVAKMPVATQPWSANRDHSPWREKLRNRVKVGCLRYCRRDYGERQKVGG